jgi:hypothetical protein
MGSDRDGGSCPTDDARFDVADDARIVEASFCCAFCLRKPGAVIVGLEDVGGTAWCFCASCDDHTAVHVTAGQIMRLRYAPPIGAPIHLIPAEHL